MDYYQNIIFSKASLDFCSKVVRPDPARSNESMRFYVGWRAGAGAHTAKTVVSDTRSVKGY